MSQKIGNKFLGYLIGDNLNPIDLTPHSYGDGFVLFGDGYSNGLSWYCLGIWIDGTLYSIDDETDCTYIHFTLRSRTIVGMVYYFYILRYYSYDGTLIREINQTGNTNPHIASGIGVTAGGFLLDNAFTDRSISLLQQNETYNTTSPFSTLTNCSVVSKTPNINYLPVCSPNWNDDNGFQHTEIKFKANDGYTFIGTTPSAILKAPSGNIDVSSGFSINDNEIIFTADETTLGKRLPYYRIDFNLNAVAVPNPSIDNNLINVTNDNSATSIIYGTSYIAHLTADNGYYISEVSITMNGIDITSDVYADGTITIGAVTGDIEIVARGKLNPSVTYNLTGCTSSNTATSVDYGDSYDTTITASSGYSLEDASVLVLMDGIEQFNVYDNGQIHLDSVTGDLEIIVIANTIKTFVFKSMDGNTTYLTLNLIKIRSLLLTINGNTRTLRVNNVDYTWVNIIPPTKELDGLSLTADSTRYIIPVGVEVIVNYSESMTFYEVIVDEHEQVETFSLMLYKCRAENERVDKTNYLQYVTNIDGVLRADSSILVPQLLVEYHKVVDFNYVYIPVFNRYYFVTDVTYGINNLVTISLRVDVLMSHKSQIYVQTALVGRNEYQYNEYLIDNERIVYDVPIVDTIRQNGSDFFEPTGVSGKIVVNVIGGQE